MNSTELIFLTIGIIFIAITNLALIIGLQKTNKTLTISHKLYIYLSISDISLGLICLPYLTISELLSPGNCSTYTIAMSISVYSFTLSTSTFSIISIIRNYATRKPLKIIEEKSVLCIIAGLNICIIFLATFAYFIFNPKYTSLEIYASFLIFSGIGKTGFLTTVLTLNCWSKVALSRSTALGTSEERMRKRNQKAVAILNLISLVYTLCASPFGLYYLLLGVFLFHYQDQFDDLYSFYHVIHIPLHFCSGFNALVYILKDERIKRFYKKKLCCKGNQNEDNS